MYIRKNVKTRDELEMLFFSTLFILLRRESARVHSRNLSTSHRRGGSTQLATFRSTNIGVAGSNKWRTFIRRGAGGPVSATER